MATPPIVKKIGKLAGFGVFPNFTCPGEVPDFKTHNLIYGFNGSGKTTLSRVFSSLERGAPEAALPPDCKFEIELDNGVVISESANLDYLKKRILVFNVDFVERNLQWSAGKAEPVFYIGEEQAELGARLAESEAKAASLRDALNAERKEAIANAKLLADNKTNTARLIAEQLNYGRRYNATNLFDDYEVQNYGEEFVLSDDDLDQQKRIFNQSEALPELHPIEELGFACSKWALYTHRALESTIGTLVAADLQKHSAMLSWLKTGVEYHEHHALTECLLCGNTLKPERLNAVKQSVDSQTGRLVQLFPELIETAKEMLRKLDAIPSRPAPEYVTPDLRALYDVAVKSIADAHSKLRNLIQEGIVRLEKRVANILRAEAQGDHFILASKGKLDEIASECHNTYNVLVRQHNAKMADFQRTKATAEKSLKRHYLAQNQTSYNELLKTVAVLEEQARISNRKYELVEREIADIQTALRKHGKAAEKITKMVQNYLGHSELEILAVEGGYEIRRYKKALAGSLSEGEKTAIALCYFLCTLEAENRKISDLVVVIDDPISSLDTKALHYALSVVRSAVGLSGQLIFFTHNIHCMLDIRKWLRSGDLKKVHTLFFLDVRIKQGDRNRTSSICEMPKLLRSYDSEYHYLFKIVHEFSLQEGAHNDYAYLMPNAMRRLIDVFLAFKHPFTVSLPEKLEKVLAEGIEFDAVRAKAIERLIQLESHSDSLDDLIAMSSLSIEETKDAAVAMMEFICAADKKHFDKLVQACA